MDYIRSKIEQMRGLIATIKQADTAYFRDDHPHHVRPRLRRGG